jgi:hypothetical protein
MELEPGMAHMELRQLRDVVTLAERLRFGRAGARAQLVPSRGWCRGVVGAP